MDQRQWRWEFEQVEQRIQHNLQKLRELNDQMAEVLEEAQRRRSEGASSTRQ
jgi:hypothetical protein